MKLHIASLLAVFTAVAVAPTTQAAQPKPDKRATALLAALQAVSPDPLGGRLGLDVASRTTTLNVEPSRTSIVARPSGDLSAVRRAPIDTDRTEIVMRPPVKFLPVAIILIACALASTSRAAFPTASQIRTAFAALDASQNGALNATEWERGTTALFQAADRDRNGYIDAADLPGSAIAPDTFLRVDRDHDNRLSGEEFAELRCAMFLAADIDRDDSLSFVEYELLIVFEQVGWVDRNASERVELSELRESLARAFQYLDTDRDGVLSESEAAYLRPQAFAQFDANRDKSLALNELVAGYRAELGG